MTTDAGTFIKDHGLKELNPRLVVIHTPTMQFSAFHPDLCYANNRITGDLVTPHYNSAIGIWAYQHEVEPQDAIRLFNRDSYAALGYFDAWTPSVDFWKALFDACTMDFNRFFSGVKREGVFMYSVNHPKPCVFIMLARMIAAKLGEDGDVFTRPVAINDTMAGHIWPLYPEIAEYYALPGASLTWTFTPTSHCVGIRAYLDYCYTQYAAQSLQSGDLIMQLRDNTLYDRVLAPQLGIHP